MKKFIPIVLLLSIFFYAAYWYINQPQSTLSPIASVTKKPLPLLSYSFSNLRNTEFLASDITIDKELVAGAGYVSYLFHFLVPSKPGQKPHLKVSGMLTVPDKPGEYPVIVMLRGYIPPESFVTGAGTARGAQELAINGFITLAPDFLGFGKSDKGSANGFEDRFQTYTTTITLLNSLKNLNISLETSIEESVKADINKVGIWAHSNGGSIALSALAITGKNYPTALWAPVSKSFPYSILYYTDEYDDQGKALRKALFEFETDYDTQLFSPTVYYKWITASIQLNQGLQDQEVPYWWSDELVKHLEDKKIDVEYHTYPDADHNMLPSGWSAAIANSIAFYRRELGN